MTSSWFPLLGYAFKSPESTSKKSGFSDDAMLERACGETTQTYRVLPKQPSSSSPMQCVRHMNE